MGIPVTKLSSGVRSREREKYSTVTLYSVHLLGRRSNEVRKSVYIFWKTL